MKTLICNCNQTMSLAAPALNRMLQPAPNSTPGPATTARPDAIGTVHTLLCRREAGAFQRAAKETAASGEPLIVACTQEQRLFLELNEQTEGSASVSERPIRFVNIRETGGWSKDGGAAMPKIAALLAAAQAPAPDPVPVVSYRSGGRCLVIGDAASAESAAALLADRLDLTLLLDGGALSQVHDHAVHRGRLTGLSGWLGAFTAEWRRANPIDLDLCTRCNACIAACPEGAIDFSYQVDLDACRGHRDCVRVCDAAGAIDFERPAQVESDTFDLVLDLRPEPAFTRHAKPQGYVHVADRTDGAALARVVVELRDAVGTFEKPTFFRYQDKLCAHSRNEQIGCRACIDVCSAEAIRSDASRKGKRPAKAIRLPPGPGAAALPTPTGGGIIVEPHLCVGCGACTTVCPSGALGYAYPGAADLGQRVRRLLTVYRSGGGRDAALLLHSESAGTQLINALGRAARVDAAVHGVPARVLPLALWHTASVGIDVWLAAIAHGAAQVWVLVTDEEAPQYRTALREQMAVAQAILSGLGYAGDHLRLIEATDAAAFDRALAAPTAQGVARAATFAVQADKRTTLDLALDHLLAQAPQAVDTIALPAAGAPFGSLIVDTDRCTMCLSCVGACPEAALADNPEQPQLRFIEKNCVQCSLCARTCPEDAITLQPRLWLADGGKARQTLRTLHEMKPFSCVRCGKPFGTERAIQNMLVKLAGHAAFQGQAAERLKMCGDCRVIDLHSDGAELRITDL